MVLQVSRFRGGLALFLMALQSTSLAVAVEKRLATPNLAFKAFAPGSDVDGMYFSPYHTGAGESIGTLLRDQAPHCEFFIENGDLSFVGGSPINAYTATLINAYGLQKAVYFSPGELSESSWSVDLLSGNLLYMYQPTFFACPITFTPPFAPRAPIVGFGVPPEGCSHMQFRHDPDCTVPSATITARDPSTTRFPNYLVPVQPGSPNTAFGSVYAPQIVAGTLLDVAFDVRYSGPICDLLFLLPGTQSDPGPGAAPYTIGGSGRFTAQQLSGPVSTSTTFSSRPSVQGDIYKFSLSEGQTTFIASVPCALGTQQGFEIVAVNDSSIDWFETSATAVGLVLVQH